MNLGMANYAFIVTGGTQGLGLATARALLQEGARVVISSRNQASIDQAIASLGTGSIGIVADNADPLSPSRLIEAAKKNFGRLDGALISVGGPPLGTVLETSDQDWLEALESVFLGSIRLIREIAREVSAGGAIALVLSTSAKSPIPGLAVSNGLRPGLAMIAKTLANEVGVRNVRVIGLIPGRIDTDRVHALDSATGDVHAAREKQEKAIALRRYGKPEEFANIATFLLSPAASYITGTTVAIDGGALPLP